MKTTIILSILIFSLNSFAQDKFHTKGLPNGYAWTASPSATSPVYAKEESLLARLQQRNLLAEIDSSINKNSFPLDCDNDINKLLRMDLSIDIKDIIKMIDEFYKNDKNLIIPVLGVYCYSVKKLLGKSEEELEEYRTKLLNYSKE